VRNPGERIVLGGKKRKEFETDVTEAHRLGGPNEAEVKMKKQGKIIFIFKMRMKTE